MSKDEIKKLFKKEKVEAKEIASALNNYFHSQGYGRRKVYVPVSREPDIISAAKEIFNMPQEPVDEAPHPAEQVSFV